MAISSTCTMRSPGCPGVVERPRSATIDVICSARSTSRPVTLARAKVPSVRSSRPWRRSTLRCSSASGTASTKAAASADPAAIEGTAIEVMRQLMT